MLPKLKKIVIINSNFILFYMILILKIKFSTFIDKIFSQFHILICKII